MKLQGGLIMGVILGAVAAAGCSQSRCPGAGRCGEHRETARVVRAGDQTVIYDRNLAVEPELTTDRALMVSHEPIGMRGREPAESESEEGHETGADRPLYVREGPPTVHVENPGDCDHTAGQTGRLTGHTHPGDCADRP